MKNQWRCLEEMYSLSGVAAEWKSHLGATFESFKLACLQKADRQSKSFPCPNKEGCMHQVVPRDTGFVGVCKDDDGTGCDDLVLTADDVEVWELNFSRLGRAIAAALNIHPMDATVGLERTRQIGAFGDPSIPVFLTLQQDSDGFGARVAALAVRFLKGFVLVAPSGRFCTASDTELLIRASAGLYTLDRHFTLLEDGQLHSNKSADELFRRHVADDTSVGVRSVRNEAGYSFRQAGTSCDIVFNGGPVIHIKNTDGAKYLDHLLHHPNMPISAVDLETKIKPEKADKRSRNSVQSAADARAKAEMHRELTELENELQEAKIEGIHAKVTRLTDEIAKLRSLIMNEGELGGNTGEQGRDNVRKAITRVRVSLKKGSKAEQSFGQHIAQFISLGYEVMYSQPEGVAWR